MPELQKICRKYSGKGQRVRVVRLDAAHARIHGERHLDHLVERGLVTRCAQRARVFLTAYAFERGVRVQHAAAAGAKHVPRQLEQPESRAMQKCADGTLLVDAVACREIQDVDAAELAVRRHVTCCSMATAAIGSADRAGP